MSVPNDFAIIEQVYKDGGYDLDTHDGLAQFIDDAVAALHAHDVLWVHIKKKPGQKNIHGHGEDAALYLLPNNKAQGCDFVKGAGAAGAQLRWGPDPEAYYTHADGWDAHGDWSDHPVPQPPPTGEPYPSESPDGGWWGQIFDVEIAKRYAAKGRPYPDPSDPRSLRWCGRTAYDIRDGLTKEESLAKHLAELELELGLPLTPRR